MAESSKRWGSDPLFSAAEVVQDSADRMDSALRMLLHEQRLLHEDSSDPKLVSLIKYYRRDLLTALETTKWQLEDFERAVDFSSLADKSNLRENATLKHKQFIRAIREQIGHVEKVTGSSAIALNRNHHWSSSNEEDLDGLEMFLSGRDSGSRRFRRESGNSNTRGSISDNDSDEIVELKADEVNQLHMNGVNDKVHAYHFLNGHTQGTTCTSATFLQGSVVNNREEKILCGSHDLEACNPGLGSFVYKKNFWSKLWGFLRNFWLSNDRRRSFMKRRKDGEVSDLMLDSVIKRPSSGINTPSTMKGKIFWSPEIRLCMPSLFTLGFHMFDSIKSNRFAFWLALILLIALAILGFVLFNVVL